MHINSARRHKLYADIVQTLRMQTGIHDPGYTQWLKETAATEISRLRTEVVRWRSLANESTAVDMQRAIAEALAYMDSGDFDTAAKVLTGRWSR